MIGTMANPRFRADRLVEQMRKRDLNAGQLAYLTGVSQPMVFYLTRDERPGVSAVIAAKLARALGCSVEYLLGMTEEPSPQTLDIDDLVMELAEIANRLTNRRRIGANAHVAHVHPHRFRHTFAIMFLRNGGNVFELQRILGHESLDTVRTYLALADVDIARAQRAHSPADNWRL